MSDINSLSVNNRKPLPIAAPLRPVATTPNRIPAEAGSGSSLPLQAKPGPERQTRQSESGVGARPVQQASPTEAGNRADRRAEPGGESLDKAITRMNEFVQSTQRDLRFNIDEETGETVVKVIDRQTGKVIRQIPDELFLKLARHLKDLSEGKASGPVHLFNAQA